jgi:1-acyl-sn-glycerol-3-phosphate acyltransferase
MSDPINPGFPEQSLAATAPEPGYPPEQSPAESKDLHSSPSASVPYVSHSSSPDRDEWDHPQPAPPIRFLTYFLLLPLIAMATIAFGVVSLIAGIWDKSGRQQHAIARAWANVLLRISFSPVTLVNRERLHVHDVAVYASNHLSYYDTPVLFAKLPFQFRILAKQSLWKVPFIGWYLNRSGQVPIDAKSGRSAIAGLLRCVKALQSGMPLVLFPEGGRAEYGETTPFQSGAAFMAIKAQVPLVPLALVGTYELLPIHTYHLTPRPLKVVVGDPIPTTGLTTRDADALTARLYTAITTLYQQHLD